MSEPVQLPPSTPIVRVIPVRAPDPIEPPKRPQTDNQNASDHRPSDGRQAAQAAIPPERHLTITREPALQSFVYRSIDAESGDVVWQWPSEQVLRRAQLLRALEEEQQQHAIDAKA